MIGGWTREYAVQLEYDTSLSGVQSMLGALADSTYVDFAASRVGVSGDSTNASPRFKLLLINKPDLVASSAVTDTPKATGSSDKGIDDVQVTIAQPSSFSPEVHVNSNIAGLFLALLGQSGYVESSAANVRTGLFQPYLTPAINVYGAFVGIVQKMPSAATPATKVRDENVIMRGCLPTSLKFSAEEGGILTLAADLQGAKWDNTFTLAAGYTTNGKALQRTNLKWQNAGVILMDALATATTLNNPVAATNVVTMQGFDLTIANGLQSKFYNSNTIVSYILGKLTAEGSFTIPFYIPGAVAGEQYWNQISDFRNGVVKRLVIYWGTVPTFSAGVLNNTVADGDLVIDMFIQYKTGQLEGDDILGSNMSFTCVQPLDGTPSITVKVGYGAAAGTNPSKYTKFGT